MKFGKNFSIKKFSRLTILALALIIAAASVNAQQTDIDATKEKAATLMKQQKFTEALPLLEKIAAAEPDDPETQSYLGFGLLAQAKNTNDEATANKLRVRARAAFVKSKELGEKDAIVDALIGSIAPDGTEGGKFSINAQADKLMQSAEADFARGALGDALAKYQKALQLDPKIYEAALFSGDVYVQRDDYANAETWYQKAIQIDPNRETAYRYSATPLMKQKKYDQARDRYIEAFISEPYSDFATAGLTNWGQITKTPLGHPKIEIPTDVKFDGQGNAQVNLNADLLSGKDDGNFAWIAYGATRTIWRKERFAKTFPNEKTYRHSLAEEADALRAVLTLAVEKKPKTMSQTLTMLKKLNDAGLLEAYILLAIPDQGIAQDHVAYLRQNRAKLRQYVAEYVVTGGGK